jgi:ribosomal protein S18 acetylase RimI-like enzyme
MPADIKLSPLWEVEIPEIVSLSNESFADYFVPVHFTEPSLLSYFVSMGVSWDLSRVMFESEKPVGFILIARRGWTSRVATMGFLPAYRNRGYGSQVLAAVINEGRRRGDRQLELEVITENQPAIQLYKNSGFQIIQDLYGYSRPAGEAGGPTALEQVDIRTVAHLVAAAGAPDLPWQLSAETLASYAPPMEAFHLDGAYVVISDPTQPAISLMNLIVEPKKRSAGRARALLSALISEFGHKDIAIPALCPATFEPLFVNLGFERTELSQFHMRLDIRGDNIQ